MARDLALSANDWDSTGLEFDAGREMTVMRITIVRIGASGGGGRRSRWGRASTGRAAGQPWAEPALAMGAMSKTLMTWLILPSVTVRYSAPW